MSDHDWLGAGLIPGRKQPALYECHDGRITILAFFRDEAAMQRYLAWRPTYSVVPPEREQ